MLKMEIGDLEQTEMRMRCGRDQDRSILLAFV